MALPSAQLGSMPGLSVPSFIPTVQVQKEPKAWERALLSILANAGAAAATQGVTNAMSNDNAAEFGGTPRSGFGKLLAPRVSDQEASRRRSDATGDARLMAEIAGRIGLSELSEAPSAKDVMAQRNVEIGQIDRNMDSMRDTMARSQIARRSDRSADIRSLRENTLATERQATDIEQLNAQERHQRAQEILQRLGQLETKQRAELVDKREEPYRAAQGRKYNAEAATAEAQAEIVKREMNRGAGGPTAQGAVNPNVAKFASAKKMSPEDAAVVQMISQALSAQQTPTAPVTNVPGGPPALTIEQILAQLQGAMR